MAEGSSGEERQGHDPAGGCGWLIILSVALLVFLCLAATVYLIVLRQ
jgi:hypothetical protein